MVTSLSQADGSSCGDILEACRQSLRVDGGGALLVPLLILHQAGGGRFRPRLLLRIPCQTFLYSQDLQSPAA